MVSLATNLESQRTAPLLALSHSLNGPFEGVFWRPAQFLEGLAGVVHTVDARQDLPTASPEYSFDIRSHVCQHISEASVIESSQCLAILNKGRRCTDDVLAPAHFLGLFHGDMTSGHNVGDITAAIRELQDLEVILSHSTAPLLIVVLFREEARGAEDKGRDLEVLVGEVAHVLGGAFGDAVDVLGDGGDGLVDPGGGQVGRGAEGGAKGAGGADEDEALEGGLVGREAGGDGLEEGGGASDVGVDEVLGGVAADVGFVEGGGVDDVLDVRVCGHGFGHEGAVGDGADEGVAVAVTIGRSILGGSRGDSRADSGWENVDAEGVEAQAGELDHESRA